MDLGVVSDIVAELGFPIVIAGGVIWYGLKTSSQRESKMWDTITGFQMVLTRFDSTLKDVAVGLKDVKSEVNTVKQDVNDLKKKVEENTEDRGVK